MIHVSGTVTAHLFQEDCSNSKYKSYSFSHNFTKKSIYFVK